MTTPKLERRRARDRARYQQRVEAGRCQKCPEQAEPGTTYCGECAEKHRQANFNYYWFGDGLCAQWRRRRPARIANIKEQLAVLDEQMREVLKEMGVTVNDKEAA